MPRGLVSAAKSIRDRGESKSDLYFNLITKDDYDLAEIEEFITTTDLTSNDRYEIFDKAFDTDGEFVLMLLNHGWNLDDYKDDYDLINNFVSNDDVELFRRLMDSGYDLSSFEQGNETPMQLAIVNGNIDMVSALLEYGWKIYWEIEDLNWVMDSGPEITIMILKSLSPGLMGSYYLPFIIGGIRYPNSAPIYEWMRDAGWDIPMGRYDQSKILDALFRSGDPEMIRIFLSKTPSGTRWWTPSYDQIPFSSYVRVYSSSRCYDTTYREIFNIFMHTVETPADQRGIDNLLLEDPELEPIEKSLSPDS